ncbi:MAG TPA: SRPBCC family protein [Pseudonocardia sp.]|jgi:hypothetical protein|nr:SRPBCC family protein [Pseudonocardia sp.]
MSDSEQLRVSRTVDATPEQLFALLSNPARHQEMDSVGMLRDAEGDSALNGVGDEFVIDMNNQTLGDYKIKNTVIAYEKDRTIGWAPRLEPEDGYTDKIGDMKAGGHTFTWHLEPEGSGTKVTQVYDWSGVTDPGFKGVCPMINADQLGESIEKAARAAG